MFRHSLVNKRKDSYPIYKPCNPNYNVAASVLLSWLLPDKLLPIWCKNIEFTLIWIYSIYFLIFSQKWMFFSHCSAVYILLQMHSFTSFSCYREALINGFNCTSLMTACRSLVQSFFGLPEPGCLSLHVF